MRLQLSRAACSGARAATRAIGHIGQHFVPGRCNNSVSCPSVHFRQSSFSATRRLSLRSAPHCEAPSSSSSTSSPSNESSNTGWLVSTPGSSSTVRSDYDAILVLGGGLLPDGGLPPWVIRRLDGAQYIYSQQARSVPIVLLGAGTPHKCPVLDSAGYVLHESTAYAVYLQERGVSPRDLLKETSSYDTVGNGYFSLTIHALPAAWRSLAVVTSAFHMPRTKAIFDYCYELGAKDLLQSPGAFSLDYKPVSDEGLFPEEVLAARAEKESAAVVTWKKNVADIRSLAQLHSWLFATHLCYSVSRQHEFGVKDDLDPRLAATY